MLLLCVIGHVHATPVSDGLCFFDSVLAHLHFISVILCARILCARLATARMFRCGFVCACGCLYIGVVCLECVTVWLCDHACQCVSVNHTCQHARVYVPLGVYQCVSMESPCWPV